MAIFIRNEHGRSWRLLEGVAKARSKNMEGTMRYVFAYPIAALGLVAVWSTPALTSAQAYTCNQNYYVNSSGHVVHSPTCAGAGGHGRGRLP